MSFENEKIVETKICEQTGQEFHITDKDLEFYDKISPIFNGKKYSIPTPRLCPEARQQRRLSFRNERKLYKRKCDATEKDIISMYSPDKINKVYSYDYWWSDEWDAMDYGVDFDFEKSFFEQLSQLSMKVPVAHKEVAQSENSEYINQAGFVKDCYLIFDSGYSENCMYSTNIWYSNNTLDTIQVQNLENSYECIDTQKSYNVLYSNNIISCKNSLYLFDCKNCEFCIGCWNLNGKKYHILNKNVSKNEYEDFLGKFNSDINFKNNFLEKMFEEKHKKIIYKYMNNEFSESVYGENISKSKNCIGFDIASSEDIKYCFNIFEAQDCMDYSYWGNKSNLIYNTISAGNTASNIILSFMCYGNVENLIYCINCVNNTKNCFGSIGLKNKQYCILNKQYTKEEYEELVPKIIEHMQKTGEWGEFFPSSMSPFGYNETVANEYFPLEKDEAISQGFNWSDYEAPFPKVEKIIPANRLPDNISDIPDDILNWAIECEITKKPFRIIPQELEFYRKHNLPIPKRHPDQRHLDRTKLRNPRKLFHRNCDKCGVEMQTTYAPDRSEIVYCEECYNREVY